MAHSVAGPGTSVTFDPHEIQVLRVVTKITCVLSMLFSISIALSYLCFAHLRRKTIWSLLVALSVCDFMSSAIYFFDVKENSTQCKLQAVGGIFFPVASFLFTDAIGLVIFLSVVRQWQQYEFRPVMIACYTSALVIPTVLSCVISVYDVAGWSPGFGIPFCWIKEEARWTWKLVGGKTVEWFSWLFVAVVYILALNSARRMGQARQTRKFIFIPGMFILLRLPSGFRSIQELTSWDEKKFFGLAILQCIGDPGQGLANGFCFALTKGEVREQYLRFIGRLFPSLANRFPSVFLSHTSGEEDDGQYVPPGDQSVNNGKYAESRVDDSLLGSKEGSAVLWRSPQYGGIAANRVSGRASNANNGALNTALPPPGSLLHDDDDDTRLPGQVSVEKWDD